MPEKLLLLFFFLAGLFLNTYKLNQIPSGFHGDEAETALQAQKILEHESNRLIDTSPWYHVPIPSFLPHTLTQAIAGNNIFGARLASAITGALALVVFYLFAKENFSRLTGLFSSLLLLTSHWWLAFSRLAISYIQTPLFQLAAFLFLARAWKDKRKINFFLSGFFTGLSFGLYFASRLVPLLILSWFFLELKTSRKKWLDFFHHHLPAFLVGFLFFALLFSFRYLKNFNDFTSRQNNVFIFSPETREWQESICQASQNSLCLLFKQIKTTFDFTPKGGDTSGQYGYRGPILEIITLILFLIGLVFCFKNYKKSIFTFLIFWLLATYLFGSVLTVPPSFMPRLTGIIPLFFLLAALPLAALVKNSKIPRYFSFPIVIIFLIIISFKNLKIYFHDNLAKNLGDPNKYTATRIAFWLKQNANNRPIVFLMKPFIYPDFAPIRYLAPEIKKYIAPAQPDQMNPDTAPPQAIFIIHPRYQNKLEEIITIYPQGKTTVFTNFYNHPQVFIYQSP